MADYWKSNERKYCDFCKCWLSDNKASVAFHESGKRHKMAVSKRISDISRKSEKAERERQKMDADLRKMEEAAFKSYTRDIHANRDITAANINTVMNVNTTTHKNGSSSGNCNNKNNDYRQVDPLRLEGISDDEDEDRRVTTTKSDTETVPNASLWVEGKSEEGYTYYWNVKTNESIWETPKEGFLSYDEYKKINNLAAQQKEIQFAIEAQKFRENADEEVARYNRERLKVYRKVDSVQELEEKEEVRKTFSTALEAESTAIGQWETVEKKSPTPSTNWELPKIEKNFTVPTVCDVVSDPPIIRFKEKTVETLNKNSSGEKDFAFSFKKRKLLKRNMRKHSNE